MFIAEPVKIPRRVVADEREKLLPRDECPRINRFGRSPIAPPHCLTIVVRNLTTIWHFNRAGDNPN
jgi:hypothetical protein